jgi:hypothetical protein
MPTTSDAIRQLLVILDSAYDRRSWHGPNLRGALRGVTPAQAGWRPGGRLSKRHNVWELLLHAAYWKYVGVRRLTGTTRGRFELNGSNWFERNGEPTAAQWRADLALLERSHRSLRAVVAALDPQDLRRRPARSEFDHFQVIAGLAAHDVYHAGQIQLLKRLQQR